MVADDHTHRAAEDGPSVAVGAGCQKDRPLLGVWHCCPSSLNGDICSHRSLAGLLMVSISFFTCTRFYESVKLFKESIRWYCVVNFIHYNIGFRFCACLYICLSTKAGTS